MLCRPNNKEKYENCLEIKNTVTITKTKCNQQGVAPTAIKAYME